MAPDQLHSAQITDKGFRGNNGTSVPFRTKLEGKVIPTRIRNSLPLHKLKTSFVPDLNSCGLTRLDTGKNSLYSSTLGKLNKPLDLLKT